MPSITLTGWPAGATVSAYAAPSIPSNSPDTDALGSSVASGAASATGTITFSLGAGRYVASDGTSRRRFMVTADTDPVRLTTGEETFSRLDATGAVTLSSQTMRLAYFTARKSETVTQARVIVGSTAAAATPTLIRFGVYTVDSGGALALIASTANDTALLSVTQTAYTKAFSASWSKVQGTRYAAGALVVTGAAAPNIYGVAPAVSTEAGQDPKLGASIGGQTDLPASATVGQAAASNQLPYVVLLP